KSTALRRKGQATHNPTGEGTMQTSQPDRRISAFQAAKLLGVSRKTLLTMPIVHLEIKRRDRILRRYLLSVVNEYVNQNSKAEQT
ncbi:hypothetical protein, partial [Thiothrix sp.]|uniref:hypothetical protein n=1 Tax=Thiothrix sp. TaxID=1032 RepID=UPI00257B0DC4